MNPYYQDESVTLFHGDCLDVLPALDVTADVFLTDPPYFKVKEDEWDNQWDKAADFLVWLGTLLDTTKPLLAAHASVWVFASPAMTSSVERLVGERFRVLNSIRWVKGAGWHQKAELAALRSFLTPWEGVVFAEQQEGDSPLREVTFESLREHLNECRERAGVSVADVDAAWQAMRRSKGQMASHWFGKTQWQFPTPEHWAWLTETLGAEHFPRHYEDLRREHESLRAHYENRRRPFNVTNRAHSTDVWNFPTVTPYPGKHPCEKPGSMLRHMIETSSRPGGLILDPFAGSGPTLEAARDTGRHAIGIEKDERYCEQVSRRLSQGVLDLGSIA